ncbi:zinc-binding dehydrogenase [Venenivibrio stagnispumantis]|uniref:NADPH:quinone reductase n=1 Tax=Venenivibrio stagnispumantis TaxID=407998 RepID=A0AA46AFQ8_9AQUI|nr:zinc-binding dehydrogenase [Venenivibrio stagnispumantis]MCW4573383.1 zinc-binding dehydrogenase [Venenivibrio stagnispumantis]SMP20764.1 NADPH:quinone reductase [Venenivibrio stagnispumantis]
MKAAFYEKLEGYKAIKIGDLPKPQINENEVLVNVKAFSLNHLDIWVMNGMYPMEIKLPHIFGSDASGIVVEVGKNVKNIKVGDEVIVYSGLSCGYCEKCLSGKDNECKEFRPLGTIDDGVSAEYVKVPAINVFKKPEGLTFEEGASIGITYITMRHSLITRGKIEQGDTVLIHGGASGVGTAGIQIAKLYNAKIITTVGDDWKIPKLKEMGADYVINYKKQDFVKEVKEITNGEGCDIVIDHIGAESFSKSLSCAKKGGRVITFGTTTGAEVNINLRYIFGKNLTIHGVYMGTKSEFSKLLKLFPDKLRPVIDSVYPLEQVQKAYEKMLSRQFFGKIVVKVE